MWKTLLAGAGVATLKPVVQVLGPPATVRESPATGGGGATDGFAGGGGEGGSWGGGDGILAALGPEVEAQDSVSRRKRNLP